MTPKLIYQGLRYDPFERPTVSPVSLRKGSRDTSATSSLHGFILSSQPKNESLKLVPMTPRQAQQVDPVNKGGGRSTGDKDCALGLKNMISKWGKQGLRYNPFGGPKVPPCGSSKGIWGDFDDMINLLFLMGAKALWQSRWR